MSICTQAEVYQALGLDTPTSTDTTDAEAARLAAMQALAVALQPQVEQLIKDFVGYNIESGHHVEFLPPSGADSRGANDWRGLWRGGFGHELLQLSQLPVRAITSVNENPQAWSGGDPQGTWPSTSLLSPGDYVVDWSEVGVCRSGQLLRLRGAWSPWPRSIRVEYDAGWSAAELAGAQSVFKRAVLLSMAKALNEVRAHQVADEFLGSGAVQSEGFGGLTVSYARAAENLGLLTSLPVAAQRLLEPRVRMSLF